MSNKWRSTLVPIFMNKGDIQNCVKYKVMKVNNKNHLSFIGVGGKKKHMIECQEKFCERLWKNKEITSRLILESLFNLVFNELTKDIQKIIPNCIFLQKSREAINSKLELWRQTLKPKDLCRNRSKTEYWVSTIQNNGEINDDVTHRIEARWLKENGNQKLFMITKYLLSSKRSFIIQLYI
ncbi:hypothetical protein CR513_48146, partial [Mucuna pruriens]